MRFKTWATIAISIFVLFGLCFVSLANRNDWCQHSLLAAYLLICPDERNDTGIIVDEPNDYWELQESIETEKDEESQIITVTTVIEIPRTQLTEDTATDTSDPTIESIPPTEQPEEPTATAPTATEESVCTRLFIYPPPAGGSHMVKEGETLTSIALLYGTSVNALVALNKKYFLGLEEEPNCILPGWVLVIPNPEITPTPVATQVTP